MNRHQLPPSTGPLAGGSATIRVLATDDRTLLRNALCLLLAREVDLTVVGRATDAGSAVALAATHRPDVVVLDVEMMGPDVVACVARLKAACPRTRVIVLAAPGDFTSARAVRAAGAACLPRKSTYDVLVRAIRGEAAALDAAPGNPGPTRTLIERPADLLTPREAEIMACVAQAMSNRQIGRRLTITEDTVKRHLRNVFRKLNVGSRIEAVNRLYGGAAGRLRGGSGSRPVPAELPG
ncbi:response regulator transcription factor [Streptomyces sp. MZ04]|uniref:response regulator transcription factor n=1 Tax=Streptomyces sp. MZ04 TaxID=2559236 RepID=UPI00107EE45E|nr:response regulator transcription factor [Streptomyces sp. MZ04]TGA95338.1 response regulator transcription factor [Streptomyces sp. MZ04]